MRFTRTISVALVVSGIAAVAAVAAQGDSAAQRPSFQSSSDLVAINVVVRSAGAIVSGLTAADFALTDNGTRQRIDRLETAAMPLDVTLVLDVSGFTGGALTTNVPAERVMREAAGKASEMAGVLRADDRIRVIASDTYNRRVSTWTAAGDLRAPGGDTGVAAFMTTTTAQGLSSVYDALAASLMESVPYGRRHAVVGWVKSRDSISATDAATLRTIAYQSDAALHVVLRDGGTNQTPMPARGVGADVPGRAAKPPSVDQNPADAAESTEPNSPNLPPVEPGGTEIFSTQGFAHTWRPFDRNDPLVLQNAATLSGGTFHDTGVLSDGDITAAFRDVFEAYRQGYVIRYAPSGVKREGWHDVVVRVPKLPNATILARHGYAIEAVPPSTGANGTPDRMAAIDGIVSAFSRRDAAGVQTRLRETRDLRGLLRDYRAGLGLWPASGRPESVLVLQLGLAGLFGDPVTQMEATRLLDHEREFVRSPFSLTTSHDMPSKIFECRWYGAMFAAFEGALQPDPVLGMADAAIARCPDDGGLYLAKAVATDQSWSASVTGTPSGRDARARATAADAIARYTDATRFSAVADEARVRAAWAAYREKDLASARTWLSGVSAAPADPVVRYFAHFVRGQVLRRLNDPDGAIAAYQAALGVFPGAQGSRVALMTLLVQLGRRADAETLARAVETAPASAIDPWWAYWLGDYRSFTARLTELRELADAAEPR